MESLLIDLSPPFQGLKVPHVSVSSIPERQIELWMQREEKEAAELLSKGGRREEPDPNFRLRVLYVLTVTWTAEVLPIETKAIITQFSSAALSLGGANISQDTIRSEAILGDFRCVPSCVRARTCQRGIVHPLQ